MIVVMQLVLTLRVHALRPLLLITLLGGTHRHGPRARGVHGRERKFTLQLCVLTGRASRLLTPANEGLELVSAALAGILVDWYDGIRISKFVLSSVNGTLNTERGETVVPLCRS